jgi:hypothetical protein
VAATRRAIALVIGLEHYEMVMNRDGVAPCQ